MKIRTFKQFLEAVSGTIGTFYGDFGPASERPKSPNTITSADTKVIASDLTGKIYTYDDYNNLYEDYLKKGGKPLEGGFTQENLDLILST